MIGLTMWVIFTTIIIANRNHTFAIGDPLNQLINSIYHQHEWDHNPPQHKEQNDYPPKKYLVNWQVNFGPVTIVIIGFSGEPMTFGVEFDQRKKNDGGNDKV